MDRDRKIEEIRNKYERLTPDNQEKISKFVDFLTLTKDTKQIARSVAFAKLDVDLQYRLLAVAKIFGGDITTK